MARPSPRAAPVTSAYLAGQVEARDSRPLALLETRGYPVNERRLPPPVPAGSTISLDVCAHSRRIVRGVKGRPQRATAADETGDRVRSPCAMWRRGVSITTVSRILNGRETGVPVRDETRARILAAASDLDYQPNLLARALRGSRSSLLGIIARDVSDPFHVQVLRGINAAARDRDYRLFLGHVDYRPDVAAVYGSMFEQSHADGIVVIGDIQGGDAALDDLAERHVYVVGVSDRIDRRRVPGVYVDNVTGTRLALDHLWNLGHRTIVCVTDQRTADGPLRAEVYEAYLRERGLGERARVYFTTQPDPHPATGWGASCWATSTGYRVRLPSSQPPTPWPSVSCRRRSRRASRSRSSSPSSASTTSTSRPSRSRR